MNPLSNPIENQQVFIFTANAKTYMKVSKLSVVCACVCVCGDDPLCAVMCCDSVVMAAWSCRRETLTQEMEILYSSCGTGAPQFTLIMITLRDRDRRGRWDTHTHTYGVYVSCEHFRFMYIFQSFSPNFNYHETIYLHLNPYPRVNLTLAVILTPWSILSPQGREVPTTLLFFHGPHKCSYPRNTYTQCCTCFR